MGRGLIRFGVKRENEHTGGRDTVSRLLYLGMQQSAGSRHSAVAASSNDAAGNFQVPVEDKRAFPEVERRCLGLIFTFENINLFLFL